MEETKTILQTSHRLRYALIIEGFLVGGCAGIISIIYRQLLSYAEQWVPMAFRDDASVADMGRARLCAASAHRLWHQLAASP